MFRNKESGHWTFFFCRNPYTSTTVVQELYNQDSSPEVDDVEGFAAAVTKHVDLLKLMDEAESSCQVQPSFIYIRNELSLFVQGRQKYMQLMSEE